MDKDEGSDELISLHSSDACVTYSKLFNHFYFLPFCLCYLDLLAALCLTTLVRSKISLHSKFFPALLRHMHKTI